MAITETTYNRYFTLRHPIAYAKGYVVGVCRSDKKPSLDHETWGTVTVPSLSKMTGSRVERCGNFFCLIVEAEIEDSDYDEGAEKVSLAAAMEKAVNITKGVIEYETEFTAMAYNYRLFSSPTDEKNYLQQTIAVGGVELLREAHEYLTGDLLSLAVLKLAEHSEGSIPNAKDIFALRDKLIDRFGR